jgi:hypothetical protein
MISAWFYFWILFEAFASEGEKALEMHSRNSILGEYSFPPFQLFAIREKSHYSTSHFHLAMNDLFRNFYLRFSSLELFMDSLGSTEAQK